MSRLRKYRSETGERPPVEWAQVARILRENQKLITLGRLAASIAHEINNPLESVTNLLYLMEQSEPEKSAEYLHLAQRELQRVVQISKQTLTFSRETATPVRIQLSELVEEVLELHVRRIGDKKLRVARQYEEDEPVTVRPGEMRQVFSNLISNAIEATEPRGRIVIRISAARRWSGGPDGRGMRLSIGDNGSGISEDVRARLGQPFYTTKGQSGTGLGLWVTQSILKRYGGSLQLRSSTSSKRHGTVFSLFLPIHPRPLAVVPGGGEAANFPGSSARGRRWRGLRLVQQSGQGSVSAGPMEDATALKPGVNPTAADPTADPIMDELEEMIEDLRPRASGE
jgi:two-component system, NtrC family, sensor kinase